MTNSGQQENIDLINQIRRTNYGNFVKIRRTIENSTRFQSDPAGNVINLSDKYFTKDVHRLRNINLNFVPTIKKYNKELLDEEINDFYWLIKLKVHSRDNTKVKELTEEEIFKKPSNKKWAPNKNRNIIKTFIEATKSGIKDELKTIPAHKFTNLSKKEQNALKELKCREDVVITDADKGGAVVILDVKDYIKESERKLNDDEHYRHLQHDPTTENNATVSKVIARFKNDKLIRNNVSDGLKVESRKAPFFYEQTKTRKEGTQVDLS